ncbi:MAG: TetR/AcrR family transcriptional regulator [Corynebacterium sp.]|uniref:TetR/AcrR family transcriptional regulator n=1 Tax=Corynebacterium sp. TaxID=1720 RepID=UPI003F8E8A60
MSGEGRQEGRPEVRRGRGRPRGGGAARTRQTRQDIVDAARRQFATHGFRGASVRSIARDAGVNPSLINHHFGDKARLLVATMALPFDPVDRIETALDGPLEDLGARLVRTLCESWDPHRDVFTAAVRSALGGAAGTAATTSPPLLNFAEDVVTGRIAARLDGPDAAMRASSVASQLIGLGLMRYVVRAAPLAEADVDAVVAVHAPALQATISPLSG